MGSGISWVVAKGAALSRSREQCSSGPEAMPAITSSTRPFWHGQKTGRSAFETQALGYAKTSIFKPDSGYYPGFVHAELRATAWGRPPRAARWRTRTWKRGRPSRPGAAPGRWFASKQTKTICWLAFLDPAQARARLVPGFWKVGGYGAING